MIPTPTPHGAGAPSGASRRGAPLLEVDGLTVALPVQGEMRTVLRDVSFELEEGKTLGLVGESGSGKSMTVRTIARLLPSGADVTGHVRFDGTDVFDLRGEALRRYRAGDVSMVFQDARAHTNPVRRIGDFLTEAMRTNDRMPRRAAEQKAVQLLADVGIHDPERRLRQYPHELSGGLLQRVMIAASVAVRPRLILADEPTTALDVTTQAEVMAILARMQREYGMAMLFITHDLELAGAVCDDTLVLYAGQVVERQSSKLLHHDPLHPYTAALVGARPEIGHRAHRLPAIPGHPTTAYEAPDGCAFAPRCRFAQEACRASRPPLLQIGTQGDSRCIRMPELHGRLLAPVPTVSEEEATS
ncbi:ABC transporter ATP-binding protein [Microbacterium hydrocarbonoxydans]|uniref:ABC transporter ATP-binding protein n=1 Tax=Microbacterium hydrocarbonoxydans TaxID=273678 RepID=UPI0007BB9EE7|nr:ABC transporter ATP-binding protein [Microbacterium hydrocarbonoxydans]GAT71874.1 oligopeptide/dipeptide ABC transporter ATPase [Microbacterium sp. HM58-2]